MKKLPKDEELENYRKAINRYTRAFRQLYYREDNAGGACPRISSAAGNTDTSIPDKKINPCRPQCIHLERMHFLLLAEKVRYSQFNWG